MSVAADIQQQVYISIEKQSMTN